MTSRWKPEYEVKNSGLLSLQNLARLYLKDERFVGSKYLEDIILIA